MYIAVKIHNNSLGKCVRVDSIDIGIDILLEWIQEDTGTISEEELDILRSDYELINNEDMDNIRSYSIGICE